MTARRHYGMRAEEERSGDVPARSCDAVHAVMPWRWVGVVRRCRCAVLSGAALPPAWLRVVEGLPLGLVVVAVAACSQKPPPDFAPDPGLVAEIAELRMVTRPQQACPGETIEADYEAVLADGRVIPFAGKYDKDHLPALHVMFLRLSSPEADAENDGDWDTDPDPLASAMEGFRLQAVMKAKPSLTASAVVEPEYSCLPHAFRFVGRTGASGPDVLVRLNILSSPFYERLLVVGIEVGDAPPFYVLQDADAVPPADWLTIESHGGNGRRGRRGSRGAEGSPGERGCPGGPGSAGGRGGDGEPGGAGGPGGPVTILAPAELPYLAGLVDARSRGGLGGKGGRAGSGGRGGPGGEAEGAGCARGPQGPAGPAGKPGADGTPGVAGPRARVITVSAADVFARPVPPSLQALLDYARRRD